MYACNEILVAAAKGVTKDQIVELAKEYAAEAVGCIEQTGDYQWKLSDQDLSAKMEKISKEEIISSAYNIII